MNGMSNVLKLHPQLHRKWGIGVEFHPFRVGGGGGC